MSGGNEREPQSMERPAGMTYRRAAPSDAFAMMRVYQLSTETPSDPVLLDVRKLSAELRKDNILWIVGEHEGEIFLHLSISIDRENRLAKLSRFALDPRWKESHTILEDAMPLLVRYLTEKKVEVLYTTTRTLTMKHQELTLGLGFKVLGIFPNAVGGDPLRVNGLTAYFFGDVLARRKPRFQLHPLVAPFFEHVRAQCGLDPIPVYNFPKRPAPAYQPMPELETIQAEHFVAHRFEKLKERKALSTHYYPFQEPNVLITDPAQKIEIFVRVIPDSRFAAVIGERFDVAVDPTLLYDAASTLLNRCCGVTYIEVINDAGDAPGIEAIVSAGYLPCAYFPSFRTLGDERRDYAIFARSFERIFPTVPADAALNPLYLDFLAEFYALEEKSFLERLKGPGRGREG